MPVSFRAWSPPSLAAPSGQFRNCELGRQMVSVPRLFEVLDLGLWCPCSALLPPPCIEQPPTGQPSPSLRRARGGGVSQARPQACPSLTLAPASPALWGRQRPSGHGPRSCLPAAPGHGHGWRTRDRSDLGTGPAPPAWPRSPSCAAGTSPAQKPKGISREAWPPGFRVPAAHVWGACRGLPSPSHATPSPALPHPRVLGPLCPGRTLRHSVCLPVLSRH